MNSTDATSSTEEGTVTKTKQKKNRTPTLIILGILCTIALAYWIYLRSTHVYTDDSRVTSNLIVLSSKVAGS